MSAAVSLKSAFACPASFLALTLYSAMSSSLTSYRINTHAVRMRNRLHCWVHSQQFRVKYRDSSRTHETEKQEDSPAPSLPESKQ